MYTQEEYFYGWLFYLLSILVLMGCTWWITGKFSNASLRQYLRLSALVFFVVPWYASSDLEYLAPAWIIAGFEGVFEGGEAFWRAGTPLLLGLAVSSALYVCWYLGKRLLRR